MKKAIFFVLTPLLLSSICTKAQVAKYTSTVNSSGGSKTLNGQVFEWSVGEPIIATAKTTNIIVTQGVLQPAEKTNSVKTVNRLNSLLNIYPNPTTDDITLSYELPEPGSLSYHLKDITGKNILSKSVRVTKGSSTERILMQSLAAGTYMLYVFYDSATDHETTSFKLDKIQ